MKISRCFKRIINIGVSDDMDETDISSAKIVNSLAILTLFISTITAFIVFFKLKTTTVFYLLAINTFAITASFYIAKKQNLNTSKLIISIFVPVFTFFAILYLQSLLEIDSSLLYISSMVVLIPLLLLPILVFGYQDMKKALLAAIPTLILILLQDKIYSFFEVNYKHITDIKGFFIFKAILILVVLFNAISVVILQKNIYSNQKKLKKINTELEASSEEMRQQNEKIFAINEELLRQQEVILEQRKQTIKLLTAVEQSDNVIMITNKQGLIEYVNPKFTKQTLYEIDEVLGTNPNILKSGYHDENFYKNMWETINSGKVWTGVFKNKRKNGELYWEQTTISPVKNDAGEIINYVAIKDDITKDIENQKKLKKAFKTIQQKNEDIINSIKFARLIQQAVLPDEKLLKKFFTDFFILYKPADIVSGDFYYFNEKDGNIYIAVGDCTGHGVPGGFMTMLGHAYLDDILNLKKITDTNLILDELRKMIINALSQKDSPGITKIGMDIALCRINTENKRLQYSGAFNSVLIIRNGHDISLAPDRMPIGIFPEILPFSQRTFELEKNDVIYMLTDGYQDQFGGPRNKKYKLKRLKRVFQIIHDKTLNEQKEILENELNSWKGENNQIDDILIIGLKI